MDYKGNVLNIDPIKWKQFEENNMQELRSFQPKKDDVVISKG